MSSKRKTARGQPELSDRVLCELALGKTGVKGAKMVSPAEVETAAWVRLKCQFGCDGYGQCLVCPPYSPTPEEMRNVLDGYKRAILIHFDRDADTKVTVAKLEREIFLRGAWKAFGLGAGPCYFCGTCALEGPCRQAERARPAMEACGIDVYTTARRAGFPIGVVRDRKQCPQYYGLVLVD